MSWLWLLACRPEALEPFEVTLADQDARVDRDVQLTVDADDAHWRFGDGSEADGATVTHRFTRGGSFRIDVDATRGGEQATTEATVHVTWEPGEVASSSALAEREGVLAAVLPDAGLLVVVREGAVQMQVSVCEQPRAVAPWTEGWVVACGDDAVGFVDAAGQVQTVQLPVGSRPAGVVAVQGVAWVTLQGTGELAAVTPDGGIERTPVLPDPVGLAWAQGLLWTASFRSRGELGTLATLDPATGIVERQVLERDPGPDSDTDSRGVPNLLATVWPTADGQALYLGGLKSNTARGVYLEGRPLTHDTTVRALARELGRGSPLRFDDRDRITALAGTPDGLRVFTLSAGTDAVDVFERDTGVRLGSVLDVGIGGSGLQLVGDTLWVLADLDRTLRGFDVADLAAPQGAPIEIDLLGTLPEPLDPEVLRGKVLFQHAGDRRMSQVGYVSCESCHPQGDEDGQTWDFTERGEGLRNTISLLGRGGLLHGPLHWSANFDEIQDFEADIRRFQGGDGFLTEADWLAHEASLGPSKAGLDADLDALAAYVSSLTVFPRSPAVATDGEAQFEALGCPACHPAPEYTISGDALQPGWFDVGTLTPASGQRLGGPLEGLDVPTLRGVWASAPYFHDGSAPTLEAVLMRDTGGLHGPALTAPEAASLAAFLRTLD